MMPAAPLTKTGSSAMDKRIARAYPQTVVVELQRIEQDLGGRAEIVGMLTLAPLSPDLRYILGLLGDPQHDQMTLAEICAAGNVLPGELLKHLTSAALLRGKVLASRKIGDGIAAVAEDVMRRAAPFEDACYTCAGIGTITPEPTTQTPNPSPGPCETCKGAGKLRYQPDLERQRLAIDMAQLLPKSGGINIAQINQAGSQGGPGGGGGSLEILQQVTDKLLYGSGPGIPPSAGESPVAEAELVEVPSGVELEGGGG